MSGLRYKTRGQSSENGKEKVYYCGHPKDFTRYFDVVSEDILEILNCAVWYSDGGEEERKSEAHKKDLSDMQLFVIPVTYQLLTDRECAVYEEFRYAMEQHIPILPLLQERGLEAIFNRVFGDLHCLNRVANDPTGLPYREKLKSFLDTVLVGDELASRIRAAFDAYIFLSYRKKDRAYADELMRLVHENEFCRDIAVWYDEYLTPGEDFNDAIRLALEKSNLFMLAVTPNLLEKMNYVLKDEYPLAQKIQKPIFPVELVETDRKTLSELYQELPEVSDIKDKEAFRKALLQAVSQIASQERDDSPEHCFFIGLAYLNGIDVKKNTEKGHRLIQFAAEKGVPEAIEKLIDMYQYGKNVARDFAQACHWCEKLIEDIKKQYETEKTEPTGLYLLAQMQRATVLCETAGENKLAGEWLNQANELCIEMLELFGTDGVVRGTVLTQLLLSEYRFRHWDFEDARQISEDTLVLLRQMVDIEHAETDTMHLLGALVQLGDLFAEDGKPEESVFRYNEALSFLNKMEKNEVTTELRFGILRRMSGQELKCEDEKTQKQGRNHAIQALSLAKSAVEEYRSEGAEILLYMGYESVAHCYLFKNPGKALKYMEKALKTARSLADRDGQYAYKRNVFSCLSQICEILEGKPKEALPYAIESIEIAEKMDKMSDLPEAKRDLWIAYNRMGDVLYADKQYQEAISFLNKAKDILFDLTESAKNEDSFLHYVRVCRRLGDVCLYAAEIARAQEEYKAALPYIETLALEMEEEKYYLLWFDLLEKVYAISEGDEAALYANYMYDLSMKAAEKFKTNACAFLIALAYCAQGVTRKRIDLVSQSFSLAEALCIEEPDNMDFREKTAHIGKLLEKNA